VDRGQQNVPVTIEGSGFVNNEGLEVEISGELIAVNEVNYVSHEQLNLLLVISANAELGARDVIVRNPGGEEGVGEGLLEIIEEDTEPDAGVGGGGGGGGGGCGCRAGHHSSIPGGLLLLVLLAFAGIARRRFG
jgi:MYXO-CTERM domain-containing protein